MFDVCAEVLDLPLEEKMEFEQGDNGNSFGLVSFSITCKAFIDSVFESYKAKGTIATDKNGTQDNVEFLNIAQDDALSWPTITHRTYPSVVNQHMVDTFSSFVRKSMSINRTFLEFFERRLGLPRGTFWELHDPSQVNGGEARCIRTPPWQDGTGVGAHTDFGSLVSHGHTRNDVVLRSPPRPL